MRDIHPTVMMRRNFAAVSAFRRLDGFGMHVIKAEVDRVYCGVPFTAEGLLLKRFDQLAEVDDLDPADAGLHDCPPEILNTLGADKAVKIRSYRGRLPGGLHGDQWVIYRLYFGDEFSRGLVVEMDVDKESPLDVAGFIPHIFMVLKHHIRGGKTDPYETAERLERAGITV